MNYSRHHDYAHMERSGSVVMGLTEVRHGFAIVINAGDHSCSSYLANRYCFLALIME